MALEVLLEVPEVVLEVLEVVLGVLKALGPKKHIETTVLVIWGWLPWSGKS